MGGKTYSTVNQMFRSGLIGAMAGGAVAFIVWPGNAAATFLGEVVGFGCHRAYLRAWRLYLWPYFVRTELRNRAAIKQECKALRVSPKERKEIIGQFESDQQPEQ